MNFGDGTYGSDELVIVLIVVMVVMVMVGWGQSIVVGGLSISISEQNNDPIKWKDSQRR